MNSCTCNTFFELSNFCIIRILTRIISFFLAKEIDVLFFSFFHKHFQTDFWNIIKSKNYVVCPQLDMMEMSLLKREPVTCSHNNRHYTEANLSTESSQKTNVCFNNVHKLSHHV